LSFGTSAVFKSYWIGPPFTPPVRALGPGAGGAVPGAEIGTAGADAALKEAAAAFGGTALEEAEAAEDPRNACAISNSYCSIPRSLDRFCEGDPFTTVPGASVLRGVLEAAPPCPGLIGADK